MACVCMCMCVWVWKKPLQWLVSTGVGGHTRLTGSWLLTCMCLVLVFLCAASTVPSQRPLGPIRGVSHAAAGAPDSVDTRIGDGGRKLLSDALGPVTPQRRELDRSPTSVMTSPAHSAVTMDDLPAAGLSSSEAKRLEALHMYVGRCARACW